MSERDAALEAAIDRVGRKRVFAMASAAGWRGAYLPKWVWWEIVHMIDGKVSEPSQPQISPPDQTYFESPKPGPFDWLGDMIKTLFGVR